MAGRFEELKFSPKENDRFTWISKNEKSNEFGTFSTLQFPESHQVNHLMVDRFIPGYDQHYMTDARIGDFYYLAYNGLLLEYRIHHFYTIQHRGKSIRHIYNDEGIRIIATYSGIFVDSVRQKFTQIPILGINYSSGEISQINHQYYLNADPIYRLEDKQWTRLPLNTDISDFKKMIKVGSQTYFQSSTVVGTINLNTYQLHKIITNASQFNDMESLGKLLLLASANGNLYVFDTFQKKLESIPIGSAIYDITIKGEEIILSCHDGLYDYNFRTKKSKLLFKHKHIIQSIILEDHILFTSFEGLFLYNKDKEVYEIIEKVEFNKRALSTWNDKIYAGSTEGLYVIDLPQLMNEVLPSLTPEIQEENKMNVSIIIALGFTSILVLTSILLVRNRNKGISENYKTPKIEITPEKIREDMLKNERLISVESIAEHYQISRVHLNRILKKYNKNTLDLIKEIKKEIVWDLKKKQVPLEKISQRVGYTTKYIKQHFLKK
ncbi:helix-turn-helix transcriptional regulator [Aquirufa rosea]|uniref:HTH araC/xylS-type domain-containing protein n=1 Tax=Aquirufa rosea TaxID=2509241 RepID=A0A4Q1BYY3_9BACT|nr:hypothetical protein [Aquirufa rosea]RXK48744.1 hypothetical protein ESB04_07230 [Aquirufa rosea]